MKMKKLLLSLGTIAAVTVPIASVIACGIDESKVNYVFAKDDKAWETSNVTKGVLNPGSLIEAQAQSDLKFLVYEISEADDGTKTFSKGSAVKLIKTVVQYLKDSNVNKASTFTIKIAASPKGEDSDSAYPSKHATLDIDLKGTLDTEKITEQLVTIKASDASEPHDSIKADKWTIV